MAAKSIKDIALSIGVEVTLAVEAGSFPMRNVQKLIGNLAETFVWGLELILTSLSAGYLSTPGTATKMP